MPKNEEKLPPTKGVRYFFSKVRRFFKPFGDRHKMDLGELRRQQALCDRAGEYQRARLAEIQDDQSPEAKLERKRLEALGVQVRNMQGNLAGNLERVQRFTPRTARPHAMPANVRLDPANLALLEAMQRVVVSKGSEPVRNVQREWGAGVDNVTIPAQRAPSRRQERQEITALPLDPGGAHYPKPDADLVVHTHPDEKTNRGYPPHIINLPPTVRARLTPEEREAWHKGLPLHPGDRARKDLNDLLEQARSIQWMDRPSGRDVRLAMLESQRRPSLIVTPHRNILLVPGLDTKPVPRGKTDGEPAEKVFKDLIERADSYAYARSGLLMPRSVKDAQRKLVTYQRERDKAISAALENETGMRVAMYEKGRPIRFPGRRAEMPRAASNKMQRSIKKEQKRLTTGSFARVYVSPRKLDRVTQEAIAAAREYQKGQESGNDEIARGAGERLRAYLAGIGLPQAVARDLVSRVHGRDFGGTAAFEAQLRERVKPRGEDTSSTGLTRTKVLGTWVLHVRAQDGYLSAYKITAPDRKVTVHAADRQGIVTGEQSAKVLEQYERVTSVRDLQRLFRGHPDFNKVFHVPGRPGAGAGGPGTARAGSRRRE